MQKLFAFLQITRANNLFIMLATLAFSYYCLTDYLTPEDLLKPRFLLLCASVVLTAAAGYIINDYMDVMLDLINKPGKVIVGNTISRRWAMFLHLLINGLALFFALLISKKIALLVLICAICLWLYSQFLKKTYLAGNLLVAALTAFTIWILFVFNPNIMQAGIWVYSLFAFGTTLIREIIKDAEDLRGDQKFKSRTLPIVVGIRKTKNVLFFLQVVLIFLCMVFCTSFVALSYSSQSIFVVFLLYMLGLVILPMFAQAWMIKIADVKKDFTRLSLLSKLVMISGIVSMIFWRF